MGRFIDRTGETNIAANGMKMTIIACRKYKDIDIQFEDGITVYNKQYGSFKTGAIKHPDINVQTNNTRKDNIGETNIAYNGMEMEIIEYYNKNNITIKFKDGTIVRNRRYSLFKKGEIKNPNINVILEKNKNHIGEINIANNGLRMTIIEYHNAKNITVQFEDGTIVYNKTYHKFKEGAIKHSNMDTQLRKKMVERIGETRIMDCGLKATIIKYDSATNITVQFEDNVIAYNKSYDVFKKGKIKMPNVINNIKLKEFAYKIGNDWYYICSHPDWNENRILSVKEIYAYKN